MPNYRRWKVEGGVYFFTLVTQERQALFQMGESRARLRRAIAAVRALRAFVLDAIVLLPDHLHMIMRLPPGDLDFSRRLGAIKYAFTRSHLAGGGTEARVGDGASRHRHRGVWQRRFYEHLIRDSRDFQRHVDYIHINPVKHEYVARPIDWPWSTFHRYLRLGEYNEEWCGHVELPGDVYIEPDTW